MAEIFPASTAADAHRRKMCGENFLHIIRNTACTAVRRSDTVVPKAKAPVCDDTLSEAVAAPTEKRGFVMPNFWGWCVCTASLFWSVVGVGLSARTPLVCKDTRTTSDVSSTTTLHPMRVMTQTVALVTPEGAKTMTVSPVASRSAAPTTPHLDPIQLHVDAVNAASMARWYAARHDYAAAFRKSAQATGALRRLASFERMGTAVQGA